MPEYIEREALIKRLEVTPIIKYGVPTQVRDGVIDLVEKQPAADVEPVKHGRWQFGGDGLVECSVCEEAYDNRQLLPRNYCPNCGAKM